MTERIMTVEYIPPSWTKDSWLAAEAFGATAHRGAPNLHERSEFSFDTYDNAFGLGFKAGELSVHFTSGSEIVANHDADTDDQFTSNLVIDSSSLATLQGLTRKYGVTTEPMRTAAEILDRYSDKVWFVENKAYPTATTGEWNAFFDLLLAQPNATERIVFKAFYDASTRLAQAKSHGFTTWAYCYGSAGAADLIDNHFPSGNIDWVGFSSGPSNTATDQSYFDWAATNDVPVLAHIMRNSTDWTTARGQGASMATINNPAVYPLTA